MSLTFDTQQHQDRFETLRTSGWYDPNTRDENFICELLVYYGKTERNDKVLEYILRSIPMTNNVFRCLHRLTMDQTIDNQNIIIECFDRQSKSRIKELFDLVN